MLAAVILLCFSVGYAAMNRRVVNSGAFYTYIARALGKPAGVAGAYVALIGYASLAMGVAGAFGYFMHLVAESLGADVPWWSSRRSASSSSAYSAIATSTCRRRCSAP